MTPNQLATELKEILQLDIDGLPAYCAEPLWSWEAVKHVSDAEVIDYFNTCTCCTQRMLDDRELDDAISHSEDAIEFLQCLKLRQLDGSESDTADLDYEDMFFVETLMAAYIRYRTVDHHAFLDFLKSGDMQQADELASQLVGFGTTRRGAEAFTRIMVDAFHPCNDGTNIWKNLRLD